MRHRKPVHRSHRATHTPALCLPAAKSSPRSDSMNREHAWSIVCEYVQNPGLRNHMRAVEIAMRAYARKLGHDEELWGIVGLLHDFDYERWPNPPDHPLQGEK